MSETPQKTTGAPGWRELRQARIDRERAERKARMDERRGRTRSRSHGDDDDDGAAPAKPAPAAPASPAKRGAKPKIGFITPAAIEFLFLLFLYGIILGLVVLSFLGTFYGLKGQSAPILAPMQIYADLRQGGNPLVWAVAIQAVLTLCQYGARVMAKHDRRWWLLYVAALGVSVYYNIQAYWEPATALMAPVPAALLIIAGDVLPEFMAVRHD